MTFPPGDPRQPDDVQALLLAAAQPSSELELHLKTVAALHRHLCPRQVLGVRLGLQAGQWLGIDLPQVGKRLIVIVETDGCFADGVSVATNCWVGHRTLRVEDYGKVAATFLDTHTSRAVRFAAKSSARELAQQSAPEARNRWEGMLFGYQRLPAEALFSVQPVKLKQTVGQIVSHPGVRALCDVCGEEILNEREVKSAGGTLCRACATSAYYTQLD